MLHALTSSVTRYARDTLSRLLARSRFGSCIINAIHYRNAASLPTGEGILDLPLWVAERPESVRKRLSIVFPRRCPSPQTRQGDGHGVPRCERSRASGVRVMAVDEVFSRARRRDRVAAKPTGEVNTYANTKIRNGREESQP